RPQILNQAGRLPDMLIASVGGGSNAAGLFYSFLADKSVKMVGVEAGGLGLASGKHAASIGAGSVGVLHGSKSYVLQTDQGQILNAHSISAGLDYPGVGPEHALWADTGCVEYSNITDWEAMDAFDQLLKFEGILSALESCHAVAEACKRAKKMCRDEIIIVNLSGRGDKDMDNILKYREEHGI
ncbi:MAG: pyridoxal-phosphate dependent enzyme, partial [Lentisphaerae bacterium]|nr:pyridoxal-phosphate dependent enzyme [Lentisphaerota bacterium]